MLGKERVQTKAPGYLLRVEPDELDLARFNGRYDRFGYRGHVDFQPELQRLFRTNASTRAAEFLSLDGLMKLEGPAPKLLTAKRIVAEGL